MRIRWLAFLLILVPLANAQSLEPTDLFLSELVADPLVDWNQDGKLTPSDEYVEILAGPGAPIDLKGWRILFNDTSPSTLELEGSIQPGERRLFINPPGDMNLNGHVALLAPDGTIVDEARFGTWAGASMLSADAHNETDEALALVDGQWRRWHATPGQLNEEPRWVLTSAWQPPVVDGWIAANASGRFSARPIYAGATIETVQLVHIAPESASLPIAEGAPGDAVRVPALTGELEWGVPGRAFRASAGSFRVDAAPPSIDPPPDIVWVGANGTWFPTIHDHGSGATDTQWRLNDTLSAWQPNITFPSTWQDGQTATIQVRARDRVGNVGEWSRNISLTFDHHPPRPPNLTFSHGRLAWTQTNATGAPTVEWHVQRVHTNPATWILPGNSSGFTDTFDPGRDLLAYEVRARDAAGNLGEAARIDVDHPGLHPQVAGIRVSKAYWGSGVQEIRIDFDRRMDTSNPPTIQISEKNLEDGRWLVNATTYYVSLASSDDWTEARHTIHVLDAASQTGSRLRPGPSATFSVDRSDPVVATTGETGWTNRGSVTINVTDTSPTTLSWKSWPAGEPEPAVGNETATGEATAGLPEGGAWVVKATAKDAAGNTVTKRWEYKIDREPPRWALPGSKEVGRAILVVEDPLSGLDWKSLDSTHPSGWTVRTDPTRHRVILEAGPNAANGPSTVTIADHAGNAAIINANLTAHAAPPPAVANGEAESDAAGRLAARFDAETQIPTQRNAGIGAWWLAGLVGSCAISVPLVRRARRGRKLPPSFAKRIREAQALEGVA